MFERNTEFLLEIGENKDKIVLASKFINPKLRTHDGSALLRLSLEYLWAPLQSVNEDKEHALNHYLPGIHFLFLLFSVFLSHFILDSSHTSLS